VKCLDALCIILVSVFSCAERFPAWGQDGETSQHCEHRCKCRQIPDLTQALEGRLTLGDIRKNSDAVMLTTTLE
jgi:hypothetical protein